MTQEMEIKPEVKRTIEELERTASGEYPEVFGGEADEAADLIEKIEEANQQGN